MSRIPIVASFEPEIFRSFVGKINPPDAFDLFDAVFRRRGKAQRRSVFGCLWRAVHFIREQSLRMQNAWHIKTDVITFVRRRQ